MNSSTRRRAQGGQSDATTCHVSYSDLLRRGEHQQAAARVAVALAQLEIAQERPVLPDGVAGKLQSVFDDIDDAQKHPSSEVELPTGNNSLARPMHIEWAPQSKSRIKEPPTVTMFTGENVHGKGWCLHCPRFRTLFGNGNDRVTVVYSEERAPGEQI